MPDADGPNVLLLVSDQHNYRYFSHRDEGEAVRTPTFDALAESGTVFEQTYCAVPLCTPSRLCTLTGREARRAGAWDNYYMLKPELATLAGTFAAAGYETCLQGKMHLEGDRQFAGFDHRPYGDLTGQTGHQPDPPAEGPGAGYVGRRRILDAGITGIPESLLQEQATARETIAFLREHTAANPETPWFLTASFSRPHWPRTAPSRYIDRYPPEEVPAPRTGRTPADDHPYVRAMHERYELDDIAPEDADRARAAYFACVDFLDEIVGDLLATLERDGLLDDTVVVYVSDHGELAGAHGLWEKRSWHEGSTRVPWMLETPAQRAGERDPATVETPVSLLDLFPTLCGLAGVDAPEGLDGVDLSAAARTGKEPARGPVFTDFLQPAVMADGLGYRMVRDGRYKFVRFQDAPDLLFDLAADPLEETNLLAAGGTPTGEAADAADAADRLGALAEETMDFAAAAETQRRDAERTERHRLGIPKGTGNTYTLPDGRLVDAGTVLYHPHVLAEEPDRVFEDHP